MSSEYSLCPQSAVYVLEYSICPQSPVPFRRAYYMFPENSLCSQSTVYVLRVQFLFREYI